MCKGTYGIMQTSNITIFPKSFKATSFKNFSPFGRCPCLRSTISLNPFAAQLFIEYGLHHSHNHPDRLKKIYKTMQRPRVTKSTTG